MKLIVKDLSNNKRVLIGWSPINQWQRIWGGRGAGATPLFDGAMNINSMKLFNNLIRNTLLAPMSVV